MSEGEWAESVDEDLAVVEQRLAQQRGQRAMRLRESVERLRTDLRDIQNIYREKNDIEQRLRDKQRMQEHRMMGSESWTRLEGEIQELAAQRRELLEWCVDRRRDVRRELESVRHELGELEDAASVLEDVGELLR